MRHEELTELISAYANGEVSGTQREFVEEHLIGCAECQERLAEFKQTRSLLTSLQVVEATDGVRERTMTAIRAEGIKKRTTPNWMRPVAIGALAVVAVVATFVAVQLAGGGSGDSLIARAHDVFAEVDSYRMTGSSTVTNEGQTSEFEFEWTFAGADRASGVIRTEDAESEYVIIGERQYSRLSDSASGSSVIITDDLLSPLPTWSGTLRYLRLLEDARDLGASTIDGVSIRHYAGTIDIGVVYDEQLAAMDKDSEEYAQTKAWADIQRQAEIEADLWIGEDDGRLRRMELDIRSPIAGVVGNGAPELMGWVDLSGTANYSGFDEPVEIEAPVDANGDVLPGWNAPFGGGAQAPVTTVG